jgi:lysophospholipid acyltransferase (LPLAT)-like uncharacterized protein
MDTRSVCLGLRSARTGMAAQLGDAVSALADDKADHFADISGYSFKKRLTIRAAGLAFYLGIQVIGRTLRFEVDGWHHWEQASRDGHIPIYTFWHHCIVPATYFWRNRGIVVMTSQSYDGEYIARFIQRFGYGAARGSSTRGSVGAVIEMIRAMRQGRATAFTIDGPKGPRHVAKMGAVLLAKKTGHPILPFTVVTSRVWELSRSWDRFQLPKPFSRAQVRIAAPIFVPADASETALEGKRLELQAALDGLEHQGEQWRAGVAKAG